uniref:RNA-binding protein NOB1 n=1 Tax=Phallusia mammillata TaxID=59560 RepID=A0A6F9DN22_9ASCI|nr:RNA-binding protein NOB1-like [Phallusia mammillata]
MKVEYLIADSGAFIRNADLYQLGSSIYTIPEVISEIKDKATKQRLAALPYQINYKQPGTESIQKITEVSKKTGDYGSLSHTDIKVLALTYELTSLHGSKDKIKEDIKAKNQIELGRKPIKETELLGFYLPNKNKSKEIANEKTSEDKANDENENNLTDKFESITIQTEETADHDLQIPDVAPEEKTESGEDEIDSDEQADDEEEDTDGWITPGMLQEMKEEQLEDLQEQDTSVACLTTDFAMQNVLIQMNLQVLSVDGMRIKTARSYVLRCHACFHVTKIMDKIFCPKCGNKTLKRVPVEIQEDGTMKMFFSRNPKVLNPRGLRYSLPTPQGGKHAHNPLLCEDQRFPHDRLSRKALQKTNVWSDDYDCNSSPFITNEVNSRAFRLGVRSGQQHPRGHRNPNAVGRKFVKRK